MQTSKLYSDILELVREVTADTGNYGEYGGQNRESQNNAAQSIEQLVIEKMEGLSQFLLEHTSMVGAFDQLKETSNLKPFTWVDGENKNQIVYTKPIKELIELYLKK